MQWTYLNSSAVPPRNLMGPIDIIGSSIGSASKKYNGPEQSNQQQHPAFANAMGQSECIGSALKFDGPK
jgi:hypothetical protein